MTGFDFSVYDGGSVCVLTAQTDPGREWLGGHVQYIERRWIEDWCHGILDDGLTVEKDGLPMVVNRDGELVLEVAQ